MNKIYKAKKIYLLRLALITEFKDPALFYDGHTKYRLENKLRVAKLIKTKKGYNYYKLISNSFVISDKFYAEKAGTYFCAAVQPLNILLDEKVGVFTTKKQLLKYEEKINSNDETRKDFEK